MFTSKTKRLMGMKRGGDWYEGNTPGYWYLNLQTNSYGTEVEVVLSVLGGDKYQVDALFTHSMSFMDGHRYASKFTSASLDAAQQTASLRVAEHIIGLVDAYSDLLRQLDH